MQNLWSHFAVWLTCEELLGKKVLSFQDSTLDDGQANNLLLLTVFCYIMHRLSGKILELRIKEEPEI